ncbi:MAG: hypothetical protein B1H03_02515 [Planctomycetales bacterium 4484_113]|nr:MAG: hypothetical protein B1H03_02515 [Planctomycetales bacterium 4484_113]
MLAREFLGESHFLRRVPTLTALLEDSIDSFMHDAHLLCRVCTHQDPEKRKLPVASGQFLRGDMVSELPSAVPRIEQLKLLKAPWRLLTRLPGRYDHS